MLMRERRNYQMKCQENRCKHFIDGIWCEVFEEIPMEMNCYGAFESIKKGDCDD